MRHLFLILTLCLSVLAGGPANALPPLAMPDDLPAAMLLDLDEVLDRLDIGRTGTDTLSAACCKTCSKGKACGDSCISRDKRCTKGAGCACDG